MFAMLLQTSVSHVWRALSFQQCPTESCSLTTLAYLYKRACNGCIMQAKLLTRHRASHGMSAMFWLLGLKAGL